MFPIFKIIKEAKTAWKILNGVFVLYKPPGTQLKQIQSTITGNLVRDLADMEQRPLMKHVHIEGPTNQEMNVVAKPSYADHILVTGPRYQSQDFYFLWANSLCGEASGVLVCSLNHGNKILQKIKNAMPTKTYRLKGILGQARDNHFASGRIVEKATWKRIKRHQIDKVCASMQSSHQRKMFDVCGVDMQTQDAYELAVQGLIRPVNTKVPMVYSIKCIDFQPPEFTLEIVCMNENNDFLKVLAFEIGIQLKSVAHCSGIQCTRYGLFTIKEALLSKHWDLENIINNIQECNDILAKNPVLTEEHKPHLVNKEETSDTQKEIHN